MDKPKLLSGEEIVARGITKIDASLPEIGLKDVVPNGSWLEQKQIQSALEARKHIIEVERIEKNGVLSHAVWRDELMLAEVTRKAGGHWQYFGHNVGKSLFLKPEEALFLMEVNCLLLTYNDVTVSLQQAYSLLLTGKISLYQYKVYASLSRIGYKVYRYEEKKLTEVEKEGSHTEIPKKEASETKPLESNEDKIPDSQMEDDCSENKNMLNDNEDKSKECEPFEEEKEVGCGNNEMTDDTVKIKVDDPVNEATCDKIMQDPKEVLNVNEESKSVVTDIEGSHENTTGDPKMEIDSNETENFGENVNDSVFSTTNASHAENAIKNSSIEDFSEVILDNTSGEIKTKIATLTDECVEDVQSKNVNCTSEKTMQTGQNDRKVVFYIQDKLKMLENRKVRPLNVKNTDKCFEKVPDVFQKGVATVNAPEEEFIPRNVFLNNICYTLDLESIKSKTSSRSRSSISRPYVNEEVNGEHIKRIKGASVTDSPVNTPPPFPNSNNRFNRPNFQNFWRSNMNFFPHNFMFQRPFMPNFFVPRYRVFSPRPPLLGMYPRFVSFQTNEQTNIPNANNKRRRDNVKQRDTHLAAIKHLAQRLKQLVLSGNTQQENIDSLQRLIHTFNTKYNMRVRLTANFDIINDQTIIETISLEEDEEPSSKKKKAGDNNKYKENLNSLKQLALKLKNLKAKELSNSKHRRAFSKIVKKFNKSYDADVYLSSNFEIIDRKLINLDSSSDSDCVIEETEKATSSKKLKNPFNILKRLSEKQGASSSLNSDKDCAMVEVIKNKKYSATLLESFNETWLPSEDDFGRAEVLPKIYMNSYLIQTKREEFLFDFLKSQPYEFDNWIDIKISFLESIEDTSMTVENDITETASINALVGPDDFTDTPSVLKKLSIISSNKEVDADPSLIIDFDVYNRDVQNFRKTNRPKPHFRVVCISESSSRPSVKDVASLHAKYDDNIAVVFAVVGVSSISYLQINPIDLPVYIPSNDLS